MQPTRPSIWSHDSNETASQKPGTLQIAVLRSVDRDGVEEVTKFQVTTNPGEAYEPAADYAIDPSGAYVTRDCPASAPMAQI